MSNSSKISTWVVLAAASIALTFGFSGCNNNPAPSTPSTDNQSPAAPADQSQSATSAPAQPAQSDQDAEASGNLVQASADQPTYSNDQQGQNNSDNDYDADSQDSTYGQPVLQASQPPPPMPQYSQPAIPGDGYLWTPGYWSYAPQGYYWVPGAWARPPQVGFLWTPGYWGFVGGVYRYRYGYWGPHIGYYGGINYGFGYVG